MVTSHGLPASTTESPILQSVIGYVACCLRPPRLTDAREAFAFAHSMGYEPEYAYVRAWLEAEGIHSQLDGGLFAATDFIIHGRRYSAAEKAYMRSKRATGLYFREKNDRMYTDAVDAASDFREALLLHLLSYREYFDAGHTWTDTTHEYAKNTAYNLIDAHFQTPAPWEAFDSLITSLTLENSYVDPIEEPIVDLARRVVSATATGEARGRLKGKLRAIVGALRESKWARSAGRERTLLALQMIEAGTADRSGART